MNKEKLCLIVILVLAIIRGSSYIFIKNIVNMYTPLEIVFFRFFCTACLLLIIYYKNCLSLNKKELFWGFLLGLTLFMAFSLQTYGLKYTTVSKQSFITSLYIIIIPIMNFIIWHKRISNIFKYCLLIVIVGLFLVSFNDFATFSITLNYGDFLTLLCASAFALNIVMLSKVVRENINIINITIVQMMSVGILAWATKFFLEAKELNFDMNFSMIYLIVVCTMLNFFLQNITQKYVSASKMGLILSLEAVFGTGFAVLFLNEILSINFIIGSILMILGIFIIQIYD